MMITAQRFQWLSEIVYRTSSPLMDIDHAHS
jgi:hypothetical protein